jgi:nucleoside-triphosphatase
MPAILLTSRPGVGKTTVFRRVVEALGASAGGFYTEEVREGGRRTGFDIVTVDGQRATLSSVRSRSPHRVSKYGVEMESLESVAAPAIHEAVESADLIVIDEIGKMELFSRSFQESVVAALNSGKPVLGTIMTGRHPFADEVRRRPDVDVVEVTDGNRDALPGEIGGSGGRLANVAAPEQPRSEALRLPPRENRRAVLSVVDGGDLDQHPAELTLIQGGIGDPAERLRDVRADGVQVA